VTEFEFEPGKRAAIRRGSTSGRRQYAAHHIPGASSGSGSGLVCFVSSITQFFSEKMVGEEFFEVVDETTLETTHQELRSVVHRTGLLHRAVRVLGSWFLVLGVVCRSVAHETA